MIYHLIGRIIFTGKSLIKTDVLIILFDFLSEKLFDFHVKNCLILQYYKSIIIFCFNHATLGIFFNLVQNCWVTFTDKETLMCLLINIKKYQE